VRGAGAAPRTSDTQDAKGRTSVPPFSSSLSAAVRRRIRRILPYGGRREIECGPAPSARSAIAGTHISAPTLLREREGLPYFRSSAESFANFKPRRENRVWSGADPPVARLQTRRSRATGPWSSPSAGTTQCESARRRAGAAPRRFATKVIIQLFDDAISLDAGTVFGTRWPPTRLVSPWSPRRV